MRRAVLLVGAVTVAVALVSAASGAAGSVQARWVIRDLGTLGGPESTLPDGGASGAMAINTHNQIVGSATTKTGQQHAVLWTLRSG